MPIAPIGNFPVIPFGNPIQNLGAVAITAVALAALSNVPIAAAHKDAQWSPGPDPKDPFAACFERCLERKDHPLVTFMCQALCAIFSPKSKKGH